jgi:putative transposase
MNLALDIADEVGVKPACDALGVSRATLYRQRRPKTVVARPASPRALSATERAELLAVLCAPRFVDASPGQVYAPYGSTRVRHRPREIRREQVDGQT